MRQAFGNPADPLVLCSDKVTLIAQYICCDSYRNACLHLSSQMGIHYHPWLIEIYVSKSHVWRVNGSPYNIRDVSTSFSTPAYTKYRSYKRWYGTSDWDTGTRNKTSQLKVMHNVNNVTHTIKNVTERSETSRKKTERHYDRMRFLILITAFSDDWYSKMFTK